MATFTVFDYAFNDEKLEKQFEQFFQSNNLDSLFSDESRTTHIKVSWSNAKGVVNSGGAYVQTLKDFSDVLATGTKDNSKKFRESRFKVLDTANGFQKMINNMKDVLNEKYKTNPEHQFNLWNIVFYNKDNF